MTLKMKPGGGALWDCTATPPKPIRMLVPDVRLEEVSRSEDGKWIHVKAKFPDSGAPLDGCVIAAEVETVEIKPQELDEFAFVKYSTVASRVINATEDGKKYGISRDYLIAAAAVLSDLKNDPSPDAQSDAFGPFQFTKSEWTAQTDRLDPIEQIDVAIALTFANTRKISDAMTTANEGSGPYIPTNAELFLVHMIGAAAGIQALKARADNQGSQPLAKIITDNQGDLAALTKRYPKFIGVAGSDSIDAVMKLVEDAFDAGLLRASQLVEELTPEDLPELPPPSASAAPWFTKAEEYKDKVAETKNPPNPKILEFFRATDFHPNTEEAWCGAFAAYCIKNCGDPTIAATVPKTAAARAATWKTWAEPLPIGSSDIPKGAVIVLAPVTKDRSGHVAFYSHGDANSVTLLGGNQGDQVKESTFKRSRVVAVRWPGSLQPASESGPSPAPSGPVQATSEDLLTMARTIFGEARGEAEDRGRQAVGWVILNRSRSAKFRRRSITQVCLQPFQFSCWNKNDPNFNKIRSLQPGTGDQVFEKCFAAAKLVIGGQAPDPTGGAMFYYATSIKPPKWIAKSPNARMTAEIGHHRFYTGID